MAVFSLFQTSPFTRSVSVPHKPWHLRHHLRFPPLAAHRIPHGLPNFRNQTNPDRWLVKIEEDVPGRMHLLNHSRGFKLKPLPELSQGQFTPLMTGPDVIVGLHSNLSVVANPVLVVIEVLVESSDNFFYTSGEDEGVFKGRDIGVFDLDDGSIAPLSDYPEYSKLWPPPDWIAPTQVQSQFEELAL
ncbi:F-box protein SKIP23 [Prunus yedoensis var. nudiflora]|uniref:F-box protein SKIP23 n=1 Tax=Prunus yedoensis var. nudiflora TaxID=2094558 RepID=A0A314Z3Q9_PRUYE|nr:F-box protein SKIP23 [Prunus yedoensis var. nudiflora]